MTSRKTDLFSKIPDEFSPEPLWNPLDFIKEDRTKVGRLDPNELRILVDEAVVRTREFNLPLNIPMPKIDSKGMEVGDDKTSTNRDPLKLSMELVAQDRILHMAESPEDTVISNSVWNLAEVTNGIPTAREQAFDFCRRNGNFSNLGFADAPPLRILLEVTKGNGGHSSTSSGKAAMLANRMRTPRDEILPLLQLASYLQDGMLRTSRSNDPKYLPRIMGGSGSRALFDSAKNLYLYTLAYKSGRCNRVYGTATRELYSCLQLLSRGVAAVPIFCRRLTDKQEYLHGTYAEKVFIPRQSFIGRLQERLPEPFIEATGASNRFQAFENRLVRTKHLITRSSAIREWQFTNRIRDHLLGFNKVTERVSEEKERSFFLRKEFGAALNANTAFANLLERKATLEDVVVLSGDSNFITTNTGASAFTMFDAEWLNSGGKYEDLSIEDLTITEDLFLRTEVSEEETFKVGGIPLQPVFTFGKKEIRTTSTVGLYQINKSMFEWADDLIGRLETVREEGKPIPPHEALRIFNEDREWVNDDTGLIGQCLADTEEVLGKTTSVVLISADRRLGNQMAQSCNVTVERLHPIPFILWKVRRNELLSSDMDIGIEDLIPSLEMGGDHNPIRHIYVDTGSVASFSTSLERYGVEEAVDIYRRSLVETGVLDTGHRFARYTLELIPQHMRKLRTERISPILKPKEFPHWRSTPYSTRSTKSKSTRTESTISSNWRA